MPPQLINFLFFQAGWFACVLPAAAGYPWVGPLFVALWIISFSIWQRTPSWVAWVCITALVVGYLSDSVLVLVGMVSFPEQTLLGGPAPIWMAFMWVNLAATLDSCLNWLRGRYFLGSLFGLLGGPLAYWGGQSLGGIELASPLWYSLLAVGIEWALAFPLLLWFADMIRPKES